MQISDCSFASRGMRRFIKSLDGAHLKEMSWLCNRGDRCVSMSLILTYLISRPRRVPECSISAAHPGDRPGIGDGEEFPVPGAGNSLPWQWKIPCADRGGNLRLGIQRIGIAVRIDARQCRMGRKLEKFPCQIPCHREFEDQDRCTPSAADNPPSTGSTAPVRYDAPGDIRNATTDAISSGVAKRRAGIWPSMVSRNLA
jgi:hypothetical protein